jgi:hypothetical protein
MTYAVPAIAGVDALAAGSRLRRGHRREARPWRCGCGPPRLVRVYDPEFAASVVQLRGHRCWSPHAADLWRLDQGRGPASVDR